MRDLYMEGMEELYARPKSYQEWNNAIEAAAELARKRVDDHDIATEILDAILKLKKP